MASNLSTRLARVRAAFPVPFRASMLGGVAVAGAAWFFPLNGVVHALLWSLGCTLVMAGAFYLWGYRSGVLRVVSAVEITTIMAFTHWAEEVLADDRFEMDGEHRAKLQRDYHDAQTRLRKLT